MTAGTVIGWDPVIRSQRLKLVVQLRRFLQAEHGYRPLMAESFSDPESHHGTVYKVTKWTCAGDTKGFSQDHTDHYLPNDRPKKL
jgi:hypothetical protein